MASEDFTNIVSDDQFVRYIQINFGAPLINLEMVNEQFQVAIADSALEYARYSSEASYQEYCILNLSAGTSYYSISAALSVSDGTNLTDALAITDVVVSTGLDNINSLFSPSHILLIQDGLALNSQGTAFGPLLSTMGAGAPLTSYTVAIQYLKQITELFGKSYAMKYIQGRKLIQVTPSPTVGGPCLIQVVRKLSAAQLYNDILFRQLAMARCMLIYSKIIGKYQGALPDGLNLSDIKSDAKEAYADAILQIKTQTAPIDFSVF